MAIFDNGDFRKAIQEILSTRFLPPGVLSFTAIKVIPCVWDSVDDEIESICERQ